MADVMPSSVIDGVVIVEPTLWKDPRGFFAETFRQEWLPEGSPTMVQGNRADRQANTLVGLHYHRFQADYWYVPFGKVLAGLHDLRPSSPTHGTSLSVELDGETAPRALHPAWRRARLLRDHRRDDHLPRRQLLQPGRRARRGVGRPDARPSTGPARRRSSRTATAPTRASPTSRPTSSPSSRHARAPSGTRPRRLLSSAAAADLGGGVHDPGRAERGDHGRDTRRRSTPARPSPRAARASRATSPALISRLWARADRHRLDRSARRAAGARRPAARSGRAASGRRARCRAAASTMASGMLQGWLNTKPASSTTTTTPCSKRPARASTRRIAATLQAAGDRPSGPRATTNSHQIWGSISRWVGVRFAPFAGRETTRGRVHGRRADRWFARTGSRR